MQANEEFLTEWAAAEQAGDISALGRLLADEFTAVGPLGFILPKQAWLARHRSGDLAYEAFSLGEVQARPIGPGTVVVTARNNTRGSYQGHSIPGGDPRHPGPGQQWQPLAAGRHPHELHRRHPRRPPDPRPRHQPPSSPRRWGMSALDGRTALVTGSSRGIGAAIAAEFARRGAAVAVHGRDTDAVASVVAGIRGDGGNAIGVTGDVTSLGDIEAVRRQVEDGLGPVDILVANAGGSFTPPAPLEDIPENGWRATIDGNLLATFLTLKSFLPGMKQRRRGVIITLASAAGRTPDARAPIPYGAAKAAIALLTQDVAAQAGPYGIRANCIAPETILTERNRQLIPAAQQASWAEFHPLKRLGTPADVAAAAAFLASDAAAWITGVVLDIAGGAVMT